MDPTFIETIDAQSPTRQDLNQITSQLLKNITYPTKLDQLSGMLPKRNYGPYGGPIAFSKTTKIVKNTHSHS